VDPVPDPLLLRKYDREREDTFRIIFKLQQICVYVLIVSFVSRRRRTMTCTEPNGNKSSLTSP
jgi:hypothetical protein